MLQCQQRILRVQLQLRSHQLFLWRRRIPLSSTPAPGAPLAPGLAPAVREAPEPAEVELASDGRQAVPSTQDDDSERRDLKMALDDAIQRGRLRLAAELQSC